MKGRVAHVAMFSGGVGSWAAAKRVAEQHGTDGLILLFCDTKSEHPDTYRFLREAAANIGCDLTTVADGRDIWDVMIERRFLANTRVDLCSRILKREMRDRYMAEHHDPARTICYVGYDWTEEHRLDDLRVHCAPWRYEAPLCQPPYLTREQVHEWAEREGLAKQYLYRIGQPHANCNGGCVKMGIGGFVRLYHADYALFCWWRDGEQRVRDALGKDVAILRDRRGGTTRPLTLAALERRIACGESFDLFDIGGCGCFAAPSAA